MLTGIQRLKNEFAIHRRAATYLGSIVAGRTISRDAKQVHSDYADLTNDWHTLAAPCVVRTPNGLDVVTHGDLRRQYAAIVDQAIALTGARSVLEFGCGDGLNIGLIKSRVRIQGFDLVPERIERARAYLASKHIDADLWVGDATKPQGRTADLAYSVHAIEQMQAGWRQCMERMRDAAPYALLIEPFYERKDWRGKLHSRACGYFRGTLRDVARLGLQVVQEFALPYLDPFNQSTAVLLKRS